MEYEYAKYRDFLNSVVSNYRFSRRSVIICQLSVKMKRIYETPEVFEYVFEKVYSCARNPFTTAYSQFMNFKNSGFEPDELFYKISEFILTRALKEINNQYVVF